MNERFPCMSYTKDETIFSILQHNNIHVDTSISIQGVIVFYNFLQNFLLSELSEKKILNLRTNLQDNKKSTRILLTHSLKNKSIEQK